MIAAPQKATAIGQSSEHDVEFGDQQSCAFFNPFLDLELSADGRRLSARGYGRTIGERKPICPNSGGASPYRKGANP